MAVRSIEEVFRHGDELTKLIRDVESGAITRDEFAVGLAAWDGYEICLEHLERYKPGHACSACFRRDKRKARHIPAAVRRRVVSFSQRHFGGLCAYCRVHAGAEFEHVVP